MSRSYSARQAIKNAVKEMYSSAERWGTCEVIHGPTFSAYENNSGQTRMDIIDRRGVIDNITVPQAYSYAKEFLVGY